MISSKVIVVVFVEPFGMGLTPTKFPSLSGTKLMKHLQALLKPLILPDVIGNIQRGHLANAAIKEFHHQPPLRLHTDDQTM